MKNKFVIFSENKTFGYYPNLTEAEEEAKRLAKKDVKSFHIAHILLVCKPVVGVEVIGVVEEDKELYDSHNYKMDDRNG